MDEIRVLSPTGACGSGFLESSFEKALALEPHFIGVDAGSTDPGPAYLGSGRTAFPKAAIERDLRIAIEGARRIGVPMLIGSAGTGGADGQLELVADIVRDIAASERLSSGSRRFTRSRTSRTSRNAWQRDASSRCRLRRRSMQPPSTPIAAPSTNPT